VKSVDIVTPLLKSDGTSQASFGGQSSVPRPVHHVESNVFHRIPSDAEATNVLVGSVDFLDKPVMAFVRLLDACYLGNVTEVPLPVRFLFILLGPPGVSSLNYHEIGRSISTLMADQVGVSSVLICLMITHVLELSFQNLYQAVILQNCGAWGGACYTVLWAVPV
jgi:hypothetical protein